MSGEIVLIALIVAGLTFGGAKVAHGAKRLFHHHHQAPVTATTPPPADAK